MSTGRKRRNTSGNSAIAKKIALENATIPIQFEDYDEVYALEWTELLQVGSEMPFAMYEELEVGMEVLAPWKDGRGSRIQYSKAFVVREDEKQERSLKNTPTKSSKKQSAGSNAASPVKSSRKKKASPAKTTSTPVKKKNPLQGETALGGKGAIKKDKVRQSAAKKIDEQIAQLIPSEHTTTMPSNSITMATTSTTQIITTGTASTATCSKTAATATGEHVTATSMSSNPSCISSTVTGEVQNTTVEAMESDTSVYAGDLGSESFTDFTDRSFGSEAFVQTSDLSMQRDQTYTDSWRSCPYWKSEVGEHKAQWRSYSTPVTLSGPEPFLHLTRRNTYPPYSSAMTMSHYDNNTYATMHNQGDDDGSSFTSISEHSRSQNVIVRDLKFVYDEWIVPLKNQLHRMELSIQRLSSQQAAPVSPFTPPSSSVTSPSTPKSTLVTPQQPSVKHPPSHPGRDKPSPILATSTPGNSESSPTEVGVAVDTPPSSFDGEGFYIGYPNKEKHHVWVSGVVQSDLNEIDKLGTDYNGLATDLLELLFKREMLTPDNYCCTQSKGKMLLNQELLRGIRLHLHRKFLIKKGVKFNSDEECTTWKECQKKLNAHIRYLHTKKKKE